MQSILWPLRILYFHGPSWGGWGFWEGRPPGDICSDLTHVPAHHFWHSADGAQECDALLERKFSAFCIGMLSVMGGALVMIICMNTARYVITIRPILSHLDRLALTPSKHQDCD